MPMNVKAKKAAQHHEVALGEIHHLGGFVHKNEPERDKAVDAAKRNPTHQLLNEVQHSLLPPSGAANDSIDRLVALILRATR
jgi:hypothetical protein